MPTARPRHRPSGWRPPVKAGDPFYTAAPWRALRAAVLARDGHRCTWIERGLRCTAPADTVHHLVDRKDGGTDCADNLTALCRTHHNAAHPAKGQRRP